MLNIKNDCPLVKWRQKRNLSQILEQDKRAENRDRTLKKEYNVVMKVFVAMSGGVDSSVAAALLQKQGYDVYGIFMKEWQAPGVECTTNEDRQMAARVAAHLGIPFAIWDFSQEYKKEVVDPMIKEYKNGRTPNPDVMCNSKIKFGLFLEKARGMGTDYIATGHYVRNIKCRVFAAKDGNKDQSYFLWTLTKDQLKYCLFPIGEYQKPQIRKIARKLGLPSWNKKDSQGICFVGKLNFAKFLRAHIPQRKGALITVEGKKIGHHDGTPFLTMGQKHGVDGKKLYVAAKDMALNTITVAEDGDPALYKQELVLTYAHWISGKALTTSLNCLVRIRYRQPLQEAILLDYTLKFSKPQRAITPGQSAVFYTKQGQLLGGGIINAFS